MYFRLNQLVATLVLASLLWAACEPPQAVAGNLLFGSKIKVGALKQKLAHRLAHKFSKRARILAEAGGADKVEVIVVYKNRLLRSEENRVMALGGKAKRAFSRLKMRKLSIPAHRLEALADDPNIDIVALDEPVSALSGSAMQTAQKPAAGSSYDFPVSAGVGVAIIDSGVGNHGDLNVIERVDYHPPDTTCAASGCDADDPLGHGTHVAGIIGGDGYHSNAALFRGRRRGLRSTRCGCWTSMAADKARM